MTETTDDSIGRFDADDLNFYADDGEPRALTGAEQAGELPFLIHRDAETGVESVIAAWPAVVGAAAGVLSFVFDRMEARDGNRRWKQVLVSLARIEQSLRALQEGIRKLEIHVSNVVNRERELQDLGKLIAAIKSYYRSYPGFADHDWRRRRTDLLLNDFEGAAWMVEQNGLEFMLHMGNAMAAHHDLFHFNATPLAARVAAFEAYAAYFAFAASTKPGSFGAAVHYYDTKLTANANAIEAKEKELPLGNRHISTWGGFHYGSGRRDCTADIYAYAVVQRVPGHTYRRQAPRHLATGIARNVRCKDRPRPDHRLESGVGECECEDHELELELAVRGDWTAASNNSCHGPMRRSCSQFYGPHVDPFLAQVSRWNAEMDSLHQQRAALRVQRGLAKKLEDQAKRALDLARAWAKNPNENPPKEPTKQDGPE